jgi:hypothetical protein
MSFSELYKPRPSTFASVFLRVFVPSWFIISLTCSAQAPPAEYVWWEGEQPVETNFPKRSPFAPSTFPDRANQLSNGDWLSTGGKRGKDILFAKYKITLPKSADYFFWVRKFWSHGPFRWRFDQDNWRICDSTFGMADDTPLKKFVNANWVSLGQVKLTAGEHALEIQLLANEGEDTACGFDCFILSSDIFIPNGKLKPGEKVNLADPGYFPFEPSADPFADNCLLDLRNLNEKTAGESGFLQRTGDHFSLGNGHPVRFWAVNVGVPNSSQDRSSVDYLARKLAKLGVNMVRFHSALFDKSDPTQIDAKQLDNLFYLISAMKREGIYTYLSFYYPLWVDASNPKLALRGYDKLKNKNPFSLLYFDPHMQEIYRGWARQLLSTKNPYTGLALARDPALGIVEITNEDSLFFWTFSQKNIPAEKWTELENQYGSAGAHQASLYDAYGMTSNGVQRFGAERISDQVRFLAQTQRTAYSSITRFLKDELHFGGLVNSSNWYTADTAILGAIDRWTENDGDMIDQHGYLQPQVTGDGAGYSVRADSTFKSAASVLEPTNTPLRFFRTNGYPQITSEIGWTNPNRYRTDSVFLSAAYGSLQNIDGLFFFAVGSNYLHDSAMTKFGIASPIMAGAFPAAALLYRRSDVASPPPVIDQYVDIDEQFQLKGTPPESDQDLAPYVGPVILTFGHKPATQSNLDLSKFIDRSAKTISSSTGQLHWNYETGMASLNTPLAQGATGFLSKAGKIELADTTIECSNEFASILIVSLDGQPLRQSKKILIQASTQEQPYKFKTEPDGKGGEKILDLGQYPFGVRKILASVSLKGATGDCTVISLDENGYAKDTPKKASSTDGMIRLNLAEDTLYQIIQR